MKRVISDPWSAQAAEAWLKLAGSQSKYRDSSFLDLKSVLLEVRIDV